MPATKNVTIAALVAATLCVAGCNSKHASAAATVGSTAASAAAAGSVAAAANSGAAAAATTSASSGASSAAPCPLTGTQASAAMGATYADPTVAYGICSYLGSNNAFTIDVHDATGLFSYAGVLATAQQDQGTSTSTSIPGLGDKAAGTGLEIVVQSGGKTIDIRNADQSPEGGWPLSVALAKMVIASLH